MEETLNATLTAEPTVSSEPVIPEPDVAAEEARKNEPSPYAIVIHLTRNWVHAGVFGFAVLCIVIGAVEALFGR